MNIFETARRNADIREADRINTITTQLNQANVILIGKGEGVSAQALNWLDERRDSKQGIGMFRGWLHRQNP